MDSRSRSHFRASLFFAVAGVGVLFAMKPVAADPKDDRLLVSQCAQCHGTDSNPYPGFENLAGKTFKDIYDDLIDRLFEDGELDLMTHQTQGYSPEQLERIARYLSALPRS